MKQKKDAVYYAVPKNHGIEGYIKEALKKFLEKKKK